jgi:hypothetical protein
MLQAINKIPLQSVFILKSSSVERACGWSIIAPYLLLKGKSIYLSIINYRTEVN